MTQNYVSQFCVSQHIQWHFSPERAPHFGGLWEATVKAVKTHLKKVVGDHHLTFEELTTTLCQIESCLNSRPLSAVTSHDEDGIEPLTPGHFLIGQPLETIPDQHISTKTQSLLRRWNLCQAIVKDFWTRWSTEYTTQLNKLSKWKHSKRNLQEGDIILLELDNGKDKLEVNNSTQELDNGKEDKLEVNNSTQELDNGKDKLEVNNSTQELDNRKEDKLEVTTALRNWIMEKTNLR